MFYNQTKCYNMAILDLMETIVVGKTVDNSGKGNCLYYAYGISLMYFLLQKRDKAITESIFNKLELALPQRAQLNTLLEKEGRTEFTRDEITDVIEPILGVATRKKAAEEIGARFLRNSASSSLFTSIQYGVLSIAHLLLAANNEPEASLLDSYDGTNPHYMNDEIFKFFRDNPPKINELQIFLNTAQASILAEFRSGWPTRVDEVFEYKKEDVVKKTKEEINADPFFQTQYLEEIIARRTIEFFTKDSNKNLNLYISYLNTNMRWATEDSLVHLHSYIQGERQILDSSGRWVQHYDIDISLAIYNNGTPSSGRIADADIVLNNLHNMHWVSLITPITLIKATPAVVIADSNTGTVDTDGTVDPGVAVDPGVIVDPGVAVDSGVTVGPGVTVDSGVTVDPSVTVDTRNSLLIACGFNICLDQLELKARKLAAKHSKASKEASDIHKSLSVIKNCFLSNIITTKEEFQLQCRIVIQEADKTHLEKHRGIKLIFNGLLNALISLTNIVISAGNLLFGRFKLIDPIQIETKSMEHVRKISSSVDALIKMRQRKDAQKKAELEPLISADDYDIKGLS